MGRCSICIRTGIEAMSYQNFAYFYDNLMKEAPYDDWVDFVKEIAEKYPLSGRNILDVGCGTGELATRLSKEGFELTGVDLSEEMLEVAMAKAFDEGVSIHYFHQDMRELSGLGQYDLVLIFCDSLNYLDGEEDIKKTFARVGTHLKEDGLFLFDVHSIHKMATLFNDQVYADNGDDVSFIWNAWKGDEPHSVHHELTFFMYDEQTDAYVRFDEDHDQRTYPVEDYVKWLDESGFECLEIAGDFRQASVDEAERIFFVCRMK